MTKVRRTNRKSKDTIVHHRYKNDDKQNRIEYSGEWLNGKPHGNGRMLKKKGQYFTTNGFLKKSIYYETANWGAYGNGFKWDE